jgi:predicted branched-subunit amino acid permease
MFFGRIVSLVMANAAVVGVFAYIPILSEYAFWFLVGAYFIWLAVHRLAKNRFKPLLMLSIVLILVAIVGVFVEIPIISNYAFWIMAANYLIVVAGTGSTNLLIVVNK